MRAHALDDGLARTPYQGWNTFYGLGERFDRTTIQSVADAIVSGGSRPPAIAMSGSMADGGKGRATLRATSPSTRPDDRAECKPSPTTSMPAACWQGSTRTPAATAAVARTGQLWALPAGRQPVRGLGLRRPQGHFCGGAKQMLDPAVAYGQFRDALLANSSNRPILFNVCNPFTPGASPWSPNYPGFKESAYNSYSFGPSTGNSWRTDTDVGFVRNIQFRDVLRNLDHNATHPEAAGPGHWNDPDYLGPLVTDADPREIDVL